MGEINDEWSQFAWRGFSLDVPLSWEPGVFQGDDLTGYIRLDDLYDARLEMRWKRSYKPENLDLAARKYVAGVRQAVKKKRASFKSEPREHNMVTGWPGDLRVRQYRWSADVDCVTAIIQSPERHRLTAIQVLFPPGGLKPATAKRVLGSFRDGPERELIDWRLYTMDIRTPRLWRLTGHQFGPGYSEMNFAGPRRIMATFRRWGPAEILLKDTNLRDWFSKHWPKGIRPDEVLETEVRGEAALALTRRPKGPVDIIRRVLARREASKKAMHWQGVAWHCPTSNRLWEVDIFAATPEEAAEANWQVQCHEEIA